MKISIIVNIYNCESYIHRCVDSILAQSYDNYEILLIDNGSTDKCSTICEEYTMKDLRVIAIHMDNYSGTASAFKTGTLKAEGSFIIYISGETYLDRNYLTKVVKAINTYNSDFILCDCIKHNGTRNERVHSSALENGVYEKERVENEILPKMFYGMNVPFSQIITTDFKAKIYKTETAKQAIDFFEEKNIYEWEYLLTPYVIRTCKKMLYMKNEFLYYCKTEQPGINDYFNEAVNYCNNISFIISDNKIVSDNIHLFRFNIIIGYIKFLIDNIKVTDKKSLIEKLQELAESDFFTKTDINRDMYQTNQQKIIIFLLKIRMYPILYVILKYLNNK